MIVNKELILDEISRTNSTRDKTGWHINTGTRWEDWPVSYISFILIEDPYSLRVSLRDR